MHALRIFRHDVGRLGVDRNRTNSTIMPRRILVMVTDITYEEADALLRRAKWNVKAAIVMQKANLTLPQALKRLKKADDSVREAIGEDVEPRLRDLIRA